MELLMDGISQFLHGLAFGVLFGAFIICLFYLGWQMGDCIRIIWTLRNKNK